MKNKPALLFWVDVLILFQFLALLATGVILRWVLPPGSGGHGLRAGHGAGEHAGLALLSLTRHQWGDIHFWIAATMVVGILIHLLLHLGWIKASIPRHLRFRPTPRTQ